MDVRQDAGLVARSAALMLLLVAWAGAPLAQPVVAGAEAIPVEAFYRHADMGDARLSPSGQRLAVSLRRGQRIALAVLDLGGGGAPRIVAQSDDADVGRFDWVNDDRLVYSVTDLHSGWGERTFAGGLFVVEATGGLPQQLIRVRSDVVSDRTRKGRQPLDWFHALLVVPRNGGDEVIVGKPLFDATRRLTEVVPMRLNVVTRELQSLGQGMPARATGWLFDSRGEPRVAIGLHEGQRAVHWRGPGRTDWQLLASMPSLAAPWSPHSVDDEGQLYVTVPEGPAGTAVLRRFDFAANRPAGEAIVSTPGFDFNGSLVRDGSGAVLGVRAETDAEATVWFDPALARWQAAADQRLPGRSNRISCRKCSGDDPLLLVRSWSDRHPGELWLFRPQRAEGTWNPVGRLRSAIDPNRMATLDFHRVPARDGLEIPVWLTLPAGADAKSRRPAVVLVHGGPWVRGGHWGWHADAQFLASRGYVVIEPEFRGSTGYGARHFKAGHRQWGRAMQDDLADALQWAVTQGWVDPARVCIAGASYGGYAALMGPIRDPKLYRCAAAWAAVTDPLLLFGLPGWSDMSDESRNYTLPQLIGDPQLDAAMLADVSPLAQAAKLRVPVLLAYGGVDRRVPLPHGERLRDALRAAGRDPEWVVYDDEAHGWVRPENRFDFARRLERFLALHLK